MGKMRSFRPVTGSHWQNSTDKKQQLRYFSRFFLPEVALGAFFPILRDTTHGWWKNDEKSRLALDAWLRLPSRGCGGCPPSPAGRKILRWRWKARGAVRLADSGEPTREGGNLMRAGKRRQIQGDGLGGRRTGEELAGFAPGLKIQPVGPVGAEGVARPRPGGKLPGLAHECGERLGIHRESV